MIASYKQKANIAGSIFMVALVGLFVLGCVLAWIGHTPSKGAIDAFGTPFGIAMAVVFFYGLWAYLKAKGRSGWWLLMLSFQVIGVIVILLLKDHAKDGRPPAPPVPQEYFG
jgi:4-amino-4-deoxy-L-arabinose transferase-like glycosyltransferase